MSIPGSTRHFVVVPKAAFLLLLAINAAGQATTAASTIALQPYTASDQSASAGVPSGWQVTSAQQTVIQMKGPQGEQVNLGATVIARNAAFQAGQRPANGVDLSMPYATPLQQKLAMVLQQGAAISGKPFSQFSLTSAIPLQLPAALGQCGRFVGGFTGEQGPTKIMGVFCSLPLDSGGTYKNIMLLAQAPPAVAAQSAPTAQAIFQSYKIPAAWLQRKLAPNTAAAPVMPAGASNAAAAAINAATLRSAAASQTSANCFDLVVLRETPAYQLPRSCGGTKPD